MAAAARVVSLKVISDSICPWCLIGTMELRKALARAQANNLPLQIRLEYRPYQLDPTLPEDKGLDKVERYRKKFGDRQVFLLKAMHENVASRARPLGLNLNFKGTVRQTTPSHRILMKAYNIGGQDAQQALLTEILRGYHELAQDIGDPDVLGGYAEKTKLMSKEEALEFLATDELKKEVADAIQEARDMGVTGVPFTVIDNKWAISGGQPSDVFYQLLERLAKDSDL
ncbi:thioredoxin-like protein [Rhizoctonia solani]|uniref:Thioredoxin-like protein n=1 Tax=Rhizoctonia solani TaxID=456999 RepID=A0A8H7H8R5_9AGAM|nr:thioredoxin-like protein [Rhizoctonia solani]KAF8761160.1 thioredoxin-like protein [Rhizoctonia solani]